MINTKFRMWDGVSKRYHYDIENVLKCLGQQYAHDGSMPTRGFTIGYNHIGEGSVFEQFTGLLDKKGNEIYQGDRVKHGNNIFIVKFSKNKLVLVLRVENDKGMNWRSLEWLSRVSKYCEVIGNIHESEVKNG